MGDLDVQTFPLTMSEAFERAEEELELILTVIILLRTMAVGAKEEQ